MTWCLPHSPLPSCAGCDFTNGFHCFSQVTIPDSTENIERYMYMCYMYMYIHVCTCISYPSYTVHVNIRQPSVHVQCTCTCMCNVHSSCSAAWCNLQDTLIQTCCLSNSNIQYVCACMYNVNIHCIQVVYST